MGALGSWSSGIMLPSALSSLATSRADPADSQAGQTEAAAFEEQAPADSGVRYKGKCNRRCDAKRRLSYAFPSNLTFSAKVSVPALSVRFPERSASCLVSSLALLTMGRWRLRALYTPPSDKLPGGTGRCPIEQICFLPLQGALAAGAFDLPLLLRTVDRRRTGPQYLCLRQWRV